MTGNSNIRVTKWVKWLEEGGEDDQVTEEQLTASVDGANSFLQPAAPAIGTSAPPTAVNTPAVNTPGINTSGSQTPLIAIKPETLSIPAAETTSEDGLLQPTSLANAPLITSPLANTENVVLEAPSTTDSAQTIAPAMAVAVEEAVPQGDKPDTVTGEGDDGTNMQVEAEQREYDTNMVPELQGAEAEQTRAILGEQELQAFLNRRRKILTLCYTVSSGHFDDLSSPPVGIGDPVGGGPQEIVEQ